MRALIVEDELPALRLMKSLVEKNKNLEAAGAFDDVSDALEAVKEKKPDVVFTDIKMPEMDGLTLVKKIHQIDSGIQIVFVTAHEQYAVNAFRLEATDYLLKPVTAEELDITVNRLMRHYLQHRIKPRDLRMRALVFGRLCVYGDKAESEIHWPTAKTKELFASFVLRPQEPKEKWALCERLWPDSEPHKAEHNLYSTINRLKTAFKNNGITAKIICKNGCYHLGTKDLSCDLWEFYAFFAENPVIHAENVGRLTQVLDLYQGNLFETENYPWCLDERQAVYQKYLWGIKQTGLYFFRQKAFEQASRFFSRLCSLAPCDEEAAVLSMKVSCERGDKEKLIAGFRRLEAALKKELQISPSAETQQIYQKLLQTL